MKRKSSIIILLLFLSFVCIFTVSCKSKITNNADGANSSDVTNNSTDTTKNKYTLELLTVEGGTLSGEGSYNAGTSVTVVAKAASGYYLDGWYSGKTRVSTSSTYTFSMPQRDYILVAVFLKQTTPVQDITIYCNNNLFDNTKYYYELKLNETVQFTAKILPANATAKTVTWRSDSTVAVVSQNGLVLGAQIGTAKITVTADNISKTIEIRVVANNIDLTLSNYNKHITINSSLSSNSANVYVTPKYGYTLQSINMYISIPVTLTYSKSGERDVIKYTSVFFSVTTSSGTNYSIYNLIMSNQPSPYHTIKSVNWGELVVTSISGSVASII